MFGTIIEEDDGINATVLTLKLGYVQSMQFSHLMPAGLQDNEKL
jgi:hypothetical protein